MAVESAADRARFLSADDFGAEATYLTAASVSASIIGIFDNPHLGLRMGDVEVADREPSFLCQSAELPSGGSGGDGGDTLTVGGITYKVIEHRPDGQGMTLITLGRSA